jgi:catechol-2,3-dioxygenase
MPIHLVTLYERLVSRFESGELSRRQLALELAGVGAALAVAGRATAAEEAGDSLFLATGLDHIALDVADVARSRDFYREHLGLKVLRETGNSCFLGQEAGFFLALFRRDQPGLNHYCYKIRDYDPDRAVEQLKAAGITPRRVANRVYFDDPDGIEVQVT